jgi:hypothetical protein
MSVWPINAALLPPVLETKELNAYTRIHTTYYVPVIDNMK